MTTAILPLAQRLACYADDLRVEDIDPTTLERVKLHVVDSIGCAIAAFDDRPVKACRQIALSAGQGRSTLIGTSLKTSPDLAAFANAAAIRYHDMNDVYVGRPSTHPSDNIAACLAVAEAEGASIEALIVSIVLAYEINCRLVDAFDLSDRGWDAPFYSLPAVALAAGKLMGLSREALAHSVALSLNDHIPLGQTRSGGLSDWKGLGDPEAGRNAVFAALLAKAGISGPERIFEGKKGVFALVTGPGDVDTEAFGGRGGAFRIQQCGLKAYPVVVYGQTTVEAALQIMAKIGRTSEISAVEIASTKRGFQQAGSDPEKWAPKTKDTADHSLPYIAARAMLDGSIGHHSFVLEKLTDPAALAMMAKISVVEDPAFANPRGNAPSTRITATLNDGRTVVHQVDDIPGFPGKPMTRAEAGRKFHDNVAGHLSAERAEAILERLCKLEVAESVAQVMAALAIDRSHFLDER